MFPNIALTYFLMHQCSDIQISSRMQISEEVDGWMFILCCSASWDVDLEPLRTAPQASMWPERKKKQKPPCTHTHTHLLVCPSQDAVLSQMAVEERPECIRMGILPLQNTSAY
ncbi:hypothetical protein Q8A67_003277 [Cirrhinus molitorella]|uniref:Uncharacterized protein n=1 Tax=Cirrhinus molitorella TaxID=172907 RepID=A0AA88TUB0_9TELE|nr:hypothetical protein Q8A67_003277 [Cirrhinus molitorella]